MTKPNKDYKVGTYLVKKTRPKNDKPICPTCAKCLDKNFCNHRKNINLMKKCTDCKNCSDTDNCDKFYISQQHSITIPIGVDETTGEIIRKKFSGKTEHEAIYNAEQFKRDNPQGITAKPKKLIPKTIESIIWEYISLKNSNGTNNDGTYKTYSDIWKRIKSNAKSWIDKPINQITRHEVEEFLNHQREKGYAQNTIKKDYQMLKQAFGIAFERKYINDNFFLGYYGIKQPKSIKKTKKVKALEYQDCITLLKYLYSKDFPYSHRDEFLICIHSGLRIGEVLGLVKSDIDFANNVIHVTRSTTSDKDGHIVLGTRTKTPSGERDVLITDLTRPILVHAIENMKPNEKNLLFCNKNGNVYTDSALNSCLKRICAKIGIINVHNHQLRHTYSTNGITAGIDYKVMEDAMGHSDINMTIDTYTDVQKEFKEKELQKYVDRVKMDLGNLLNEFYANY